MHWTVVDLDYPEIIIDRDPVIGLAMWIEKILECSQSKVSNGTWNIVIADLWPNGGTSRLIGHVQMDDQNLGYDTGFRVCAYLTLPNMVFDDGDDRPLIKSWLDAAVRTPSVQVKLHAHAQTNSFEIRLSHWGENPISDAILIPYM